MSDKLIIRMDLIVEVPSYLKPTDIERLKRPESRQKIAEISVNDMLKRQNTKGLSAIVLNTEFRQGDNN